MKFKYLAEDGLFLLAGSKSPLLRHSGAPRSNQAWSLPLDRSKHSTISLLFTFVPSTSGLDGKIWMLATFRHYIYSWSRFRQLIDDALSRGSAL